MDPRDVSREKERSYWLSELGVATCCKVSRMLSHVTRIQLHTFEWNYIVALDLWRSNLLWFPTVQRVIDQINSYYVIQTVGIETCLSHFLNLSYSFFF